MKHIKYIIALSLTLCFLGCEKTEEIHNTADKVGISRVTYFPVFAMSGNKYISIVKGGTFTDPGVTAKEGESDLPVKTTGSVDVNKVGVYDITYSATNKDNFSASVIRTVAVLPAAEQQGVDISGKYTYASNSSYVATIQKLAAGFYIVDNVWGSSDIPSYIITTDGRQLTLPLNTLSGYGPVQGSGTLDAAGNLTYTVDLLAYGFTGISRKWKKQ
jgi:hypothetical protein